MKGLLLIISAPSGTGKTTILKELIPRLTGTVFSVSHTTRAPRKGEQGGRDYHFVDKETFLAMKEKNEFLESAEVHGNYYGTSKADVIEQIDRGLDVFLDIDVQGARQVREHQSLPCLSIFITPPSWEEQKRRLLLRGTDSEEVIRKRLDNARKEMKDADMYDYIIVNDTLPAAVDILRAIIIAERSRHRRNADGTALTLPSPN